jgi:hypothetical protein
MKRNTRNSSFSPYYEIQDLPCRMVNLVMIRFSLIKESICRVLSDFTNKYEACCLAVG